MKKRRSWSQQYRIAISPEGEVRFIYSDQLAKLFSKLGIARTQRASHVEPASNGKGWTADLTPVGGPILGPFSTREIALRKEAAWLNKRLHKLP